MINRFYLENYLSFEKIDLEFDKGLVVFTGPSGAGKSVLMSSILSLFGTTDNNAKLSEIVLEDLNIVDENYGIEENDEIIIKQTTGIKTRYLLNNQTVSKKNLKIFTSNFSKHLHLKDTSDFDSKKIVKFLDFLTTLNNKKYQTVLDEFNTKYSEYHILNKRLNKILEDEKELDDLIENTKFEIGKITKIDPKIDEYDELKELKSNLTKKDKFDDAFTAPVHGFGTAKNYYQKSSARQYLKGISKPTLAIQAVDDPFMTVDVIPDETELGDGLTLEVCEHGGHVGFVRGSIFRPKYWLPERVCEFLTEYL